MQCKCYHGHSQQQWLCFNYRNLKSQVGTVSQQVIKMHPLYPGYLVRRYKIPRSGIFRGQDHSTSFFHLKMGAQGLCEEQQVTDCTLNSLWENSECSQNKTNTGMGHIECISCKPTEEGLQGMPGKCIERSWQWPGQKDKTNKKLCSLPCFKTQGGNLEQNLGMALGVQSKIFTLRQHILERAEKLLNL